MKSIKLGEVDEFWTSIFLQVDLFQILQGRPLEEAIHSRGPGTFLEISFCIGTKPFCFLEFMFQIFAFFFKLSYFFIWCSFVWNLRQVLSTRLCYAFAWNSPGYDIKKTGKFWFLVKVAPDFWKSLHSLNKLFKRHFFSGFKLTF